MNILSIRNLKYATIVLGLIALALAFRPSKAKHRSAKMGELAPIQIQSPGPVTSGIKIRRLPAAQMTDGQPMVASRVYSNSNYVGLQIAAMADSPPEEARQFSEPALAPESDLALTDVLDKENSSSSDLEVSFEETPAVDAAEPVEPVAKFAQAIASVPSVESVDTQALEPAQAASVYTADARPVDYAQPLDQAAADSVMTAVALNDAAAQKAVHHIEYGKSLARRNATEVAGQEFLGALRVLAESNDTAIGGNQHTKALRNGLLAIREANDFKTDDPQRQLVIDVASVVEGHQSQILGADEARSITASTAMRRYFDFAGQQLGKCGGQNAVAAEALYCLGKMKSIASLGNPDPESLDTYEAIIFHHASLTSDASNFRSANELGVLLAKNGHLDAAEAYLKNSLRLKAIPQAWANLAKVHLRKGGTQDQQLAQMAVQEYQVALSQPPQAATGGLIQWVEPNEFIARSPAMMHDGVQRGVAVTPSDVVPASATQPEANSPSLVQRISSLFVPKNSNQ